MGKLQGSVVSLPFLTATANKQTDKHSSPHTTPSLAAASFFFLLLHTHLPILSREKKGKERKGIGKVGEDPSPPSPAGRGEGSCFCSCCCLLPAGREIFSGARSWEAFSASSSSSPSSSLANKKSAAIFFYFGLK